MQIFTSGSLTYLVTDDTAVTWPENGEPTLKARKPESLVVAELAGQGVTHLGAGLKKAGVQAAAVWTDGLVAGLGKVDGAQQLFIGPPPSGDVARWSTTTVLKGSQGAHGSWVQELDLLGDDGGKPPDAPSVSANPWGVAVVLPELGTALVLRDPTAGVASSLSLPSGDHTVYASPSESGLVLTFVERGRAVVAHVGSGGDLLGSWQGPSAVPAQVMGDHILVWDHNEVRLGLLDRSLGMVASLELPFAPAVAATSIDGRHFAVANDSHVLVGTLSSSKMPTVLRTLNWSAIKRQKATKKKKKKSRSVYGPKRGHGEPCIGFAAKPVVSPPWDGCVGEFTVELVVRSSGGVGQGLWLRASGKALKYASPLSAEIDGVSATFVSDGDGLRAELPGVELPVGVVMPLDPSPKGAKQKEIAYDLLRQTHITVTMRCTASGPGQELLTIEMAPQDVGSSPLKWTRPLNVS